MNCSFISGVKRIIADSGFGGLYKVNMKSLLIALTPTIDVIKGVLATVLKQSSNQGLRFMFMGWYRDFLALGKANF